MRKREIKVLLLADNNNYDGYIPTQSNFIIPKNFLSAFQKNYATFALVW